MDEQKLETHRAIEAIKRQQRMMTMSFVALLMFIGGFALMYVGDEQIYPWIPTVATALSAIGFVAYIALRAWAIFAPRKKS